GFTDFNSFAAAMRQSGTDTLVSLGAGETLTLKGVSPSAITSANVVFSSAGASSQQMVLGNAIVTPPPDDTLQASGKSTHWFSSATAGSTVVGTSGNDSLTASAGN